MSYELGIVLAHEIDSNGILSDESLARIDEGIRLYKRGDIEKLVISGGHLQGHGFSIAQKMANYALEKGISDVILEDASLDTLGQMVFLKEGVIDPRNIKNFALITHYWHAAKTEFIAYYIFGNDYTITMIPIEKNKYPGKRRWDFSKLPTFINTFTEKEPKKAPLIEQLIVKHPWYGGQYPDKPFVANYFLEKLKEMKERNSNF